MKWLNRRDRIASEATQSMLTTQRKVDSLRRFAPRDDGAEPYRSIPRAATGSVPRISSPRTITTSSIMLTTTQTWLGTIRTTSPTLGRVLLRAEIEEAVLLGKARDFRFGMFEDQAVALQRRRCPTSASLTLHRECHGRARRG